MKTEHGADLSASVKARLLNIARDRREEFQLVLTRYAAERLLYRLSISSYRQQFVLKGATLFAYWTGDIHRPTRDLDLLGYGDPQIAHLVDVFIAICTEAVAGDGLVFLADTVRGDAIKAEDEYEGVRITLASMLGKARIPVQIDVGFGDAVTPGPEEAQLPTLLNMPAAHLLAYPRETTIAEKCEAMVHRGMSNSRLKDFYDLWYLATHFDFDGASLARAIAATFERRRTTLPSEMPPALKPAYYSDPSRQDQWRRFLQKSNLPTGNYPTLEQIMLVLQDFVMPPIIAISSRSVFAKTWQHNQMVWSNAQQDQP
jgi:predicted nucleotidyltransferase component of viral defense system